jgi:hypothetical protein
LRDNDHALPLPPGFQLGWELLAFSGGQPLHVFGEWNGRHFIPFAAALGRKWLNLSQLIIDS